SYGCARILDGEGRKSRAPPLLTLWLAMNPAISPKMIHAMRHMQLPATKTPLDPHSFRNRSRGFELRGEPSDLILRRPRSWRGRLEGWAAGTISLVPSFETRASFDKR